MTAPPERRGTGPAGPGTVGTADSAADTGVLPDTEPPREPPAPDIPSPRVWSPRRGHAALVALVLLTGSVLALAELVRVRLLDRAPLLAYDRALARLEELRWEDPAVLAASGTAILVGAILAAAAVLPGRGDLLAINRPTRDTAAYATRRGVGRLVRARVLGVENVVHVRVWVRRRSITVRVVSRFRQATGRVRDEVGAELSNLTDEMGLARPPQVRLYVVGRR